MEYDVAEGFEELLTLWSTGLRLSDPLAAELLRLAPAGTFTRLPDAGPLGVSDRRQFLRNLKDVHDHHRRAMEQGCFIEMISLRAQHLELWLRMYWVVKNSKSKLFGPEDTSTLGDVISRCEAAQFDPALILQLRAFNKVRIDAVHRYMLGDLAYRALEQAASAYDGLEDAVAEYVVDAVGRPATVEDMVAGLGTLIWVREAPEKMG